MATNIEPMTDERLQVIRERSEQCYALHMETPTVSLDNVYPDLLHDYHCDTGALVAEIERLRAEIAAMRPVVEAVAKAAVAVNIDGDLACPFCERWIGPALPHADDCTVLAARAFVAQHPAAENQKANLPNEVKAPLRDDLLITQVRLTPEFTDDDGGRWWLLEVPAVKGQTRQWGAFLAEAHVVALQKLLAAIRVEQQTQEGGAP